MNVVDFEKQRMLGRSISVMFYTHLADQVTHMPFKLVKSMHDHVLPALTKICKFVDSDHELNVFAHDAVHIWLLVDSKVTGVTTLDAINVQLEHSCELWPKGLADTVMIEVKYRNLVTVAHHAFELLVYLDAEQNCINVKATSRAGA